MITVHTIRPTLYNQIKLDNFSHQDVFCWFFPWGSWKYNLYYNFTY